MRRVRTAVVRQGSHRGINRHGQGLHQPAALGLLCHECCSGHAHACIMMPCIVWDCMHGLRRASLSRQAHGGNTLKFHGCLDAVQHAGQSCRVHLIP